MTAAALLILAVWVLFILIVAVVIDRFAPVRDEDEELRHPIGLRRLP